MLWKLGVVAHICNPRTPVPSWEAEARESLRVCGATRLSNKMGEENRCEVVF